MNEIKLDELVEKEREMEGRIENLEKLENSLITRMQRIERRLGIRSERTSPRKGEMNLRRIISEEMREVRESTPRIGLGERKQVLEKEVKGILKEHKISKREESKGKEKREKVERKKLLKGEIEKIIKSEKGKEKEEKKPKELKELEITTNHDARRLFKILLKTGSVNLDEAKKQLEVDEEIIQEWANDLKNAGIIDIVESPYGSPEFKLRSMAPGTGEKEKS